MISNWSGDVFTIGNGREYVVVDLGELNAEIRMALMRHGLEQKLRDAAAQPRDPATGKPASEAAKIARVAAVAEALRAGIWARRGGGMPPLDRAALFAAIATVRGTTAEAVEAARREWPDERLRSYFAVPEIVAEYARRTARPASEAALFEGL